MAPNDRTHRVMNSIKDKVPTFFKAMSLKFLLDHKEDEWEYTEEPHVTRRQMILAKHPEIKKLMGYDPTIAFIVTGEIVLQLVICYLLSIYQPGYMSLVILAYVVGASLNHSLGSAIHEIGHNLAFGHKYGWANRVLSIAANMPMAVPIAISYKKYHHDHHRYLGHEQMDVDIPLRIEAYLFKKPLTRVLWLLIHPAIHGIRPFIKSPKPIQKWEAINFVAQAIFDIIIYQTLGLKPLAYLVIGTFFGLGAHPLAAHFISEHYLFANNQATHSYYGPLNPILFNVGYHVEHHDFPYIPHTRLYKVKELAPEFYDHLPHHTSWLRVMWDFIWMDNLGPQGRGITNQDVQHPEFYSGMTGAIENEAVLQS